LDSLEEKASNLAVGSGSAIKDFTLEYNKLEEKINDIKKILGLNFNDKKIKTLNDQLVYIQ
jgi:hypothetical protein